MTTTDTTIIEMRICKEIESKEPLSASKFLFSCSSFDLLLHGLTSVLYILSSCPVFERYNRFGLGIRKTISKDEIIPPKEKVYEILKTLITYFFLICFKHSFLLICKFTLYSLLVHERVISTLIKTLSQ